MMNFKLKLIVSYLFVLILLFAFSNQTHAKTIKTEHYKFSTGSWWSEDEKKVIENIAVNLDNIWEKVNETLEQELPPKLKLAITKEGLASRSLREEEKVLLNAIHIKNLSLRDCLDRIAHETAHFALYKISKGEITKWENKFLDEGIALYIGYLYVDEIDELNILSQKIAKQDIKDGKASLTYLRDWENNVRQKQRQFIKNWKRENPGENPGLEDFIKGGYRTYFTSYSFFKTFTDKYSLSLMLDILGNIGAGDTQAEAFQKITGESLDKFILEWHNSLI